MDIAVSVVSLADICIRQVETAVVRRILLPCANLSRYGTLLVSACKSYKHADHEVRESILLIESRWIKIQRQLELLRDISSSLDEDYQLHQNSVLQVLQGKIQAAISLVNTVIGNPDIELSVRNLMSKKGEIKRAKYAVLVKSSLKSILLDLKDWSEVFDVSWYLIIRLASKNVDEALRPVVSNEGDPLSTIKDLREIINTSLTTRNEEVEKTTVFLNLDSFNKSHIALPHSSAEIWSDVEGKNRYLIDEQTHTSNVADICRLAKILRKIDPLTFGILRCEGVLKYASKGLGTGLTYRLAFNNTVGLSNPQYLRVSLEASCSTYSLDERFSLAQQVAKAVMFIHSSGFVHKNIRPETILTFRDQEDRLQAFLTGFQSFRLAEGKTTYQGDDEWQKNIYRHPTRQGVKPESDYLMQHDIYSLGVCLLELGLGSSFVIHNTAAGDPEPSPQIRIAADFSIKDNRQRAFHCKRTFLNLAKEELPARMGQKYTETVVTCLNCLDKTDNAFGDEKNFVDENGVLVGVRYIEKILTVLLDIKI